MNAIRTGRGVGSALLGIAWLAAHAAAQGITERVSVDSSGAEADGDCWPGAISADGQIVAFWSNAGDLVAADTNDASDVFVHDRTTGLTERVSVDSSGAEGNGSSGFGPDFFSAPALSADGQIVAFPSYASNLVAGDQNGSCDVFVHDRTTGLTERVSVASSGAEGDGDSFSPSLSADGQVVAFVSDATNLVAGDKNRFSDIFVHDRSTGKTERITRGGNNDSFEPSLSADGQIVAFASWASTLVGADTNGHLDVFVNDRSTGLTERVSVDSSGAEGNGDSLYLSITADGQCVAFGSVASNLVAGDTNATYDVFAHDRATGLTERISVDSSGAEGNDGSLYNTAISSDGQIVAFSSYASNLVADDTNGSADIFVHDRSTGITRRVSVNWWSGGEGNRESWPGAISADGQIVAFQSYASNLVEDDTNGRGDIFVHDPKEIDATWSNYGAGFPGTNGVPAFTARGDPVLDTTLTLDLENSYDHWTVGLFFIGLEQATLPTGWGGDLLVVPLITIVVGVPPSGLSFTGDLPLDAKLYGTTFDLQAIVRDPGAAEGVAFTPGLELLLGK